jgi:hypothetical protein
MARYNGECVQPEEVDLPHTDWKCEDCSKLNSCFDAECQYCEGNIIDFDEEEEECEHEWTYTGTEYGGDDTSYHGEGRCYCIHCFADGDA